jgi:hypothetical protein
MATRSRGPAAGFGWLSRGISASFRHPKPLFGGAFLVVLAALVPALITMPMQFYVMYSGTPPHMATLACIAVISMLLGLLVLPIYAGYLQVVDTAEAGQPARARDVVKPFREGKALRVIGYGIVMAVIYLAIFALIFVSTGSGVGHWYLEALTAQANHLPPPTTLPEGFWRTMLLAALFGVFMMGFYAIGLGQVTLRNRGVFGAVSDGVIGALKNLLPLLMLVVGLLVVWVGIVICFVIAAMVIALLGKLAGAWLALVLVIPLYIALLLAMFTMMFGVMYHLWRDVCGDDMDVDTAAAIAV